MKRIPGAGMRDRYVRIESVSYDSVSDSGQPTETWSTFTNWWAHREDEKPNEELQNIKETTTQFVNYSGLWIVGVVPSMRLIDTTEGTDVVYEIHGTREIGTKDGLIIRCFRVDE